MCLKVALHTTAHSQHDLRKFLSVNFYYLFYYGLTFLFFIFLFFLVFMIVGLMGEAVFMAKLSLLLAAR